MKVSQRTLFVLILIFVLVISGAQANAVQAVAHKSSVPGRLKVWIPAGMIGRDYWIYVNGHIVSAPPHGPASPKSNEILVVASGRIGSKGNRETMDGWEIWTKQGLILKMRHEEYDDRLMSYIHSGSGDDLHLFQPFEIALRPAKYTVEVAILSEGASKLPPHSPSSFPFVITRKYAVDVIPGQVARIYPGVPDDWTEDPLPPALAAYRVCPKGAVAPDADQLRRWVGDYMDDPMVKILRGVDSSSVPSSQGVVVLNLPPAQGGPREFDGKQIAYIVDAIAVRNPVPGHREVADCQNRFPQFPQAYALYDKTVSFIDDEIESFRKLAPDLTPRAGTDSVLPQQRRPREP
jgi:hypothetical protein